MSLFFFSIFAVYGGMHLYMFLRIRHAIGFGAAAGTVLAVFMLIMIAGPFLVHMLERSGYETAARTLAQVTYLWMALVFLYFCSSLLLELFNLVLRIAGWIGTSSWSAFAMSAKPVFFAAFGFAAMFCVYGYFAALDIGIERLRIETGKLPSGVDRLTIVQISDVHLGLIVRHARLKKIIKIIKSEKPDIFVSTGDLVDAEINHLTGLAELLRGVDAPYGKYAITGNHEYYAGLQQALSFTRDSGFTLLRGEAAKNSIINIVGVDDPTGVQRGNEKPVSERDLLSSLPRDRFTLLMKHRPVVDEKTSGMFDLQLSGHTHKGQIFPFTYISKIAYPLNDGRFDLPGGSILRVSRGTGTWGPPIRFLSPPEITVIELVRKPS